MKAYTEVLRTHSPRAAVFMTMKDVSAAWGLSIAEQAQALGIAEATWSAITADHRSPLPPGTFQRAGYLHNLRRMLSAISRDDEAQEFFFREPGIMGDPSPLARATSDAASLQALCAEIDAINGEGSCPEPFAWSPNELPT
jgi:hypothetical protein